MMEIRQKYFGLGYPGLGKTENIPETCQAHWREKFWFSELKKSGANTDKPTIHCKIFNSNDLSHS